MSVALAKASRRRLITLWLVAANAPWVLALGRFYVFVCWTVSGGEYAWVTHVEVLSIELAAAGILLGIEWLVLRLFVPKWRERWWAAILAALPFTLLGLVLNLVVWVIQQIRI